MSANIKIFFFYASSGCTFFEAFFMLVESDVIEGGIASVLGLNKIFFWVKPDYYEYYCVAFVKQTNLLIAMKNNLKTFLAVLSAGFIAFPAYAATPYVSSNFGASFINDVKTVSGTQLIKGGLNLTGAAGVSMDDFRLEAEVGGLTNIDQLITFGLGGSVSITSLLANCYYDMALGGVKPYVTAGIGPAWVSADDWFGASILTRYSAKYTTLGYQFGAGIAIPLSDSFAVDARYRYFSTSTIKDNTLGDFTLSTHNVLLGLRYSF